MTRYEARTSMFTIRAREGERGAWRNAARVAGFDSVSGWARAVLNLGAKQTLAGAMEDVPESELEGDEGTGRT